LRSDSVLLADGRLLSPCTVFEYPDWVDVIALTAARNVVLVDQYRHAVGQIRAEFPAGVIDEREVPLAAIKRELLEETGYTSQERHRLGGAPVNPVLQTNRIHCSWRSVHKKSSSRISTRAKPSARTSCLCRDEIHSVLRIAERGRHVRMTRFHCSSPFPYLPELQFMGPGAKQ